jgi:uncharacterized membrane protein
LGGRASLGILAIYMVLICLSLAIESIALDPTQDINVSVRVEPPLIKYYINISAHGEAQIFLSAFEASTQLVCTATPNVRLQLISANKYIAMIREGSGWIICASAGIGIINETLEVYIYPLIINGSVYNISTVWLPYYLVNVISTPNAIEVLPGENSRYIMRFNTNETIYMRARIFPYPRELVREITSPSQDRQASQNSDQELGKQILLYIGVGLLGGLTGYFASRIAPAIRSRIVGRDLERDIIDLLTKNPRGMSLSLISKTLNAPKSSTWKKLRKLVEKGVVEEFEGPGKGKLYRLKRERG